MSNRPCPGISVDNSGSQLSIRGATAGEHHLHRDDLARRDRRVRTDPGRGGSPRSSTSATPAPCSSGPIVSSSPPTRSPMLRASATPRSITMASPSRRGRSNRTSTASSRDYLDETYSDTGPDDPDWPVVLDTTVDTDGEDDALTETIVDLTAAFAESGGPIVLRVEPDPAVSPRSDEYWSNRPIYTWVQQAEASRPTCSSPTTSRSRLGHRPAHRRAARRHDRRDLRTGRAVFNRRRRHRPDSTRLAGRGASPPAIGDRTVMVPAPWVQRMGVEQPLRSGPVVRHRRPRHLPTGGNRPRSRGSSVSSAATICSLPPSTGRRSFGIPRGMPKGTSSAAARPS